MGAKQNKKPPTTVDCVPTLPGWRVSIFVLVQIVVVVLVAVGYDVPTALGCAAGASLVAAHTARDLLTPKRAVRGA